MNGHHIETEKQILPELLSLDTLSEISVGGGNHPDINPNGSRTTNSLELSLLQDSEQLGLDYGRDLTDLIQQNGAAMSQFKPTLPS
jgi:hypothetical protein